MYCVIGQHMHFQSIRKTMYSPWAVHVLVTEAVVELTMELASAWASTVDYSDSVMW